MFYPFALRLRELRTGRHFRLVGNEKICLDDETKRNERKGKEQKRATPTSGENTIALSDVFLFFLMPPKRYSPLFLDVLFFFFSLGLSLPPI